MKFDKNRLEDHSLSQRTENLYSNEVSEWIVIENENDIYRLLDSNPCLLEGNRGSGKSMLMRYAELQADQNFKELGLLTIFVSFENSMSLQAINIQSNYNPTLQWMCMKTVFKLEEKMEKLQLLNDSYLTKLLVKLNINPIEKIKLQKILQETITTLESSKEAEISRQLKGQVGLYGASLGVSQKTAETLLRTISYPTTLRDSLMELVSSSTVINKIVILFDEAAHALYPEQQNLFFNLFKDLTTPSITPKAAVYPHVTSYGDFFDPGQDAQKIEVLRDEKQKNYFNFFKNLFNKRNYFKNPNLKQVNDDILKLMSYLAFGNPRMYINLVDRILRDENFTDSKLRTKIREFIETYLNSFIRSFETKYEIWKDHFETREILEKHIIQKLKEKNEERLGDNSKKENISTYFIITDEIYNALKIEVESLSYLFRISPRGRISIGGPKNARLFILHPAIAIKENIIKSPGVGKAKDWLKQLDKMKRENYVMITAKSIPEDLKKKN